MKTDLEFEQELAASGMVHFRMLPDDAESLDRYFAGKKTEASAALWDGQKAEAFCLEGVGSAALSEETPGAILLSAPARGLERWPDGCPDDGDYCNFGALNASLIPALSDWRAYNRIVFEVYPRTKGMHSPMLSLQLYNDGEVKIPDRYAREGFHTVYLRNGQWNTVIWEFPSLPRDRVTKFTFQVNSYGKELSMEDVISMEIRGIRLEQVSEVSHTLGWETDPGMVVCPTNGYLLHGKKTAVTSENAERFTVTDADGTVVFSGETERVENEKGCFTICDFSDLQEAGMYRIRCGSAQSVLFTVSEDPWYRALWKAVNYLYSERCGCPIGRGHGTCHTDIIARHAGKTIVYNGGWHDAGDVSQQTLQTGEVASALLKAAAAVKDKHTALYARLMEEAAWGIDFVLKTRFGDGFRATSAGICRWTDGFIGTFDDCPARVHDHSFENYLLAGVEAEAGKGFETMDPELADKCRAAAVQDFDWAEKAFIERGPELPSFYEHTYNSSISLYHAVAARTAVRLFAQTEDARYEEAAAAHLKAVIRCQENGDTAGCPTRGFFYRNEEKRTIVHFNHQARYECFAECFAEALRVLPGHPDCEAWKNALTLYGGYIRDMNAYSAPYGMQPAGLHKKDEYLDGDTFRLLHLLTAYEDEKENYKEQLESAMQVNADYAVRMFPIWFSFRGNAAVHLSGGLSAARTGEVLGDEKLTEIAREQLYFLFGKNPFGQSLMYGEGSRFPALYGALNGEMMGAVPVGMETRFNEDVPYWPVENNATYKEVWTSSVGKVLTLIAALL